MLKRLCIITPRYPTALDESAMPFVQQLVWAFVDMRIECSVICPMPVNRGIKALFFKRTGSEKTIAGHSVSLYFPKYFHFGMSKIGPLNFCSWNNRSFYKAVHKVFSQLPYKPDALYGHFVAPSGISAAKLGKGYGLPSFLGYGESSSWSIKNLNKSLLISDLENICGVIAVSTKNQNDLISMEIIDREKMRVFPNSVREDLFFPRDRMQARKQLGIYQECFVVSFVGHFIQRKGIDALGHAIRSTEGIYAIYAGKGNLRPEEKNCLFCGVLPPDQLPWFYSASDVFVLPTHNEGMSNAIIEAMACGLPIISSDLPFNYDILDESNAILIDPTNNRQLADALVRLRDDSALRDRMGQASLEKAHNLTLNKRAARIIEFMECKSKTEVQSDGEV